MSDTEESPNDLDHHVTLEDTADPDDDSSSCSQSSDVKRRSCAEHMERCGGYNLVLAFCCFMCYFIFCGIAYTSGVYFVFFKEEFGTGSGVTSWVGSIHFGVVLLNAPLAGFLTNRFGFRPVVIVGGLIATIGLFATAFANTIYEVVLTFSVITGFGVGLVYVPGLTIVSYFEKGRVLANGFCAAGCGFGQFIMPYVLHNSIEAYHWRGFGVGLVFVPGLTIVSYFEKGRVLANGFCAAGCGFGQFVMPYVLHNAIEAYHWRGSMFICAGIALQFVVLGALMRPPKVWQKLKNLQKHSSGRAKKKVDFGVRFLKDPDIILTYIFYILFSGSYGMMFVHITAMTETLTSASRTQAVFVVSVLGLSTIFGRVASGLIGQDRRVDTFLFHIISTLIAGLSAIFVPLLSNYPCIVAWAVMFGLFTSPGNCLYQILLLNFVDISDLNTTVPHLTVAMAIGMLLAAPIAGWIYDLTNVYGSSFYLGGVMVTVSSLLLIWPYIKYKRRHKVPISVDIKQQVKAYSFGSMLGSQYFVVSTEAPEDNRDGVDKEKASDGSVT